MKLIPRSNGVYMLEYYEGEKRVRISTGERMRDRAEDVARRILAGQHERAQTWTLKDALTDCYDRVWSKQKSAAHTARRVNKLIKHAGAVRAAAIDYNWLVELGQRMETEWRSKPATINRFMAMLSKALTEAHKRGKLTATPKVPYRKEPNGKLRWLTRDEEQRLLDGCANLWPAPEAQLMRNLIVFLVDTGARLGEALKAGQDPIHRIGAPKCQVTFTDTKNGKARSVPLTSRASSVILPDWSTKLAVDRFSKLRDHCGMPDVSLHTLRHTCASRLVQGGMDLYRVMHWLGHSSLAVTQRYAHLAPSALAQGLEILAQSRERTPTGEDSPPRVPAVPKLFVVK